MIFFSLFRIILIGFFVIFQFSFLNLAVPLFIVPNILFILASVYSIVLGFREGWKWLVVLGALTDLITFSTFGKNIILFVCMGYLASFLSKRISLEEQRGRFLAVAFLMFCAVAFGDLSETVWSGREINWLNFFRMKGQILLLLGQVFVQTVLSAIVFYPIFWIITKFEGIVSVYVRRSSIY